MEKMTIADVASMIGSGDYTEYPDDEVAGVSTDSRAIPTGCLFVPIAGARFDGHDYIDAARAAGAGGALCHREYGGSCPTVRVGDTLSALSALAGGYRAKYSPIVVAVTGSVGKTTTKELTAAVMARRYDTHKTAGNKNNEIGLPLSLLGLEARHGAAVFELGMSDFGEISRLSRLARPHIAIITNIGTSHIEFLGSREGIARAKCEIADGMEPGGHIVIPFGEPLLEGRPGLEKLARHTFGFEPEADFRAENVALRDDGSEFDIVYPGGRAHASLNYAGRHNVLDALAGLRGRNMRPECLRECRPGCSPPRACPTAPRRGCGRGYTRTTA